ncbi:MAG: hypothetical protein KJ941_12795, partial [Bacteroidetes bacterium]|nr:hypothetical protein [Bacteroidota bacterium]
MRIVIFLMISILFSCKTEVKDTKSLEELATLQSEIQQLKMDGEMKDSMLNESLSFFNEVQENLVAINVRSEDLKRIARNPETSNFDKQWMLNEIQQINNLRKDNALKIEKLQEHIKSSNLNLNQLNLMIETLQQDIAMRDEQIAQLQEELGKKDIEYSTLFDAYQQKEYDLESAVNERNTAYFVYGTEKELVDNGVLERKNGFIGFGRKVKMKGDFNQDYFSKLDIRAKSIFKIVGEKAKILST